MGGAVDEGIVAGGAAWLCLFCWAVASGEVRVIVQIAEENYIGLFR
jgi:hypothetical protein